MKTSLCSLFITLSLLFVFQEKKTQEQTTSINLQDYVGRYQADPANPDSEDDDRGHTNSVLIVK